MKKIFIILFMLSQMLVGAWEVQFKTGYDFYRMITIDKKYDPGFILGVEYVHANRGIIELGTGVEYVFGNTKALYSLDDKDKSGYMIPIYLLGKLNYYTTFDNTKSFYGLTRLGYAVSGNIEKDNMTNALKHTYTGGLYYGVGLGFEVENFVFEGIYDAKYSKSEFLHKFGLRTGIRIGNYKKKLPNIKTVRSEDFINYVPEVKEKIEY